MFLEKPNVSRLRIYRRLLHQIRTWLCVSSTFRNIASHVLRVSCWLLIGIRRTLLNRRYHVRLLATIRLGDSSSLRWLVCSFPLDRYFFHVQLSTSFSCKI